MNNSIIPFDPIFIVIFIVFVYYIFRAQLNKKRIAKISRDLGKVLRQYGIGHIDILSTEKMEKYVTTSKLLTSIENKIEKLKKEKAENKENSE
jgi:regulatory protein YycI of two-component signal transduction system YycFG